MTTYLRRQARPWHPRVTLSDHVDFAAAVSDRMHLTLLEQWDELPYTAPAMPNRSRASGIPSTTRPGL